MNDFKCLNAYNKLPPLLRGLVGVIIVRENTGGFKLSVFFICLYYGVSPTYIKFFYAPIEYTCKNIFYMGDYMKLQGRPRQSVQN